MSKEEDSRLLWVLINILKRTYFVNYSISTVKYCFPGNVPFNESEFNSFVKKHNLSSKIIFLGPQYGPKKNFVLANTDIFAFPTYYKDECFPLGLLEALRWGLPIITTKEGAIPDIVNDGICGFLVKHQDSNALAEKLELLIQNKDLREAMGKKGRLRYEQNFTLQHFEHNLITILNKCLLKAS